MDTFDFNFNGQSLEVFPPHLINNPMVVYHGTCAYHSADIEKYGLVVNSSAYNADYGKILCDTLESQAFSPYDHRSGFWNWTTAQGMRHYIHHCIEAEDFKLSFSPLSGECLLFTQGASKGGQAMGDIRKAQTIIDTAVSATSALNASIPQEVKQLFELLSSIDSSSGVIYAVQLPKDLGEISNENGIIYSKASIPRENILAKVVIPASFTIPFTRDEATTKRNEKLTNPAGIRRIIHRFQEGHD